MLSRRLLLPALVLLVLAAALYLALRPAAGAKGGGPKAVSVQVAPVTVRDVPLVFETVGQVVPLDTVTLRARVDGQVAAVPMREGEAVAAGDVLLRLDDAELRARLGQAEAALARDDAELANARSILARNEALKDKNYVSEEALRTARTQVAALAATVKASRAALEAARLQLSYTVVRAPFAGRVGGRLISPGASVQANATVLAVVNRLRPVQVAFALPDRYLGYVAPLRRGGRLPLTLGSEHDAGLRLQGFADFVDNAVDTGSGTIRVKATFANADERLTPGAYVKVALTLDTLTGVLTVPATAVQQRDERSTVFVVGADGKAELRDIRVSDMRPDVAVVASGLRAGERVVSGGFLRLSSGTAVKVQGDPRSDDAPEKNAAVEAMGETAVEPAASSARLPAPEHVNSASKEPAPDAAKGAANEAPRP